MNTQTLTDTAPAIGDNSEHRMDALLADMKVLGKAEANGQASRPMAGLKVADAALATLIDERDAGAIYDAYQAEVAKISTRNPLARKQTADSRSAQVAKLRCFIKIGMLPGLGGGGGPALLRHSEVIKDGLFKAGTKVFPSYESMLRIIGAQLKQPNDLLTDEQIAGLVSKDEPKEKDEMEKLVKAYRANAKLHELVNLPGTEAAVRGIGDAIIELGGDLPPLTKEAKAETAFMTKARAMGLVPRGLAHSIATVSDAE